MFFLNGTDNNTSDDSYPGYAGYGGNIVMIIISVLGIIINSIFSIDYLRSIISIKNRNNAGISAVEKILCMIAVVETFISVFWLINNSFMSKSKEDSHCRIVAHFEIFLNLFDWLILSTSLYQIKIILLNPQEILESGKRVLKYIIGCLIISLASLALSIPAEIGGKSPMLTCFIDLDNIQKGYQYALFWIFFTIPLFCFGFGIYQVYLIMTSMQYKNDKNNREFFIEYSYFVITYIISSILLIVVYVINYIVIKVNYEGLKNNWYKGFISVVTFLTCSTPLIVGVIRYYRTGLLKKIFGFCRKRRVNNNLIEDNDDEEEQQLVEIDERSEGNRMFKLERIILEKLIIKYFTAVSFALGKSKYKEEEIIQDEKDEKSLLEEKKDYIINREEILKDLDLSLNDDIKVLGEANIDIEVTEYNSTIFKKLRELEGLNEDKIIEMFQPKKGTNQLIHQINDTLYINSSNKLLMLKKIKREQMYYFQNNILPHLYDYFVNHPNSIICRVFGCYRIKIDKHEEVFMALIYNIQESIANDSLDFTEEKVRQMKLSENEFKSNLIIDTKTNDISIREGSFFKPSLDVGTYKEDRKKSSFRLHFSEYESDKLDKILQNDMDFFNSKNINGYHYLVFEKELKGNNFSFIDISSDDGSNGSNRSSKINSQNSKIKNEIKKYVFNSNKPNTIYCICINGI